MTLPVTQATRNLHNRAKLLASLELFIKVFLPIVSGREFFLGTPIDREPHQKTVIRALEKAANLEIISLLINIPPGHGKSMMVCFFVAWTMARWPDSQYLYISYSKEIASKATAFIRSIMQTIEYQAIFDVHVTYDQKAKEHFKTTQGGSIRAFGAAGAIVGQDGGLPNLWRFSGAVIMDDLHKINEIHSDTVRESVIRNYKETILQRVRGERVLMLSIGHRVHEEDALAHQLSGNDIREWTPIILKAVDEYGHVLCPEIISLETLREKQAKTNFVYASQYQQDPIADGDSLFKPSDFALLDEEPEIICTFITADTAETAKQVNDATVFSFWGVYKIAQAGVDSDIYGLHWIDCAEHRIEPRDLQPAFLSFWARCMRHDVKPKFAAIEKKSTGVTLVSVLQDLRGLIILPIERSAKSGSKGDRFASMQWHIASKLISFTDGAEHYEMCVKHMGKITRNGAHAHDDICDTVYDAIKLVVIDKNVMLLGNQDQLSGQMKAMNEVLGEQRKRATLKQRAWNSAVGAMSKKYW